MDRWQDVRVGNTTLEVLMHGSGDPVVMIQTALTADELMPLARQGSLADSFRIVTYHRRGYAGSSPVAGPGSIPRDARDCVALLDVLQLDRVHVVGVSYSAAVALQMAAKAPDRVASLCLIEPPPVHVPSAEDFRAANDVLQADHRALGAEVAVDRFLSQVIGPRWHSDIEQHLPDAVEQVSRDAETFLTTDIPALLSWRFTAADAARIRVPVLYVGGSDSGEWFAQVHGLVVGWLPHAEAVIIPGADHSLALTHASQLADALAGFLSRHPMPGDRNPGP